MRAHTFTNRLSITDNVDRMKYFEHPLLQEFRKKELVPRFNGVYYYKPEASRDESAEGYWICTGYKGDARRPYKSRPRPSQTPPKEKENPEPS